MINPQVRLGGVQHALFDFDGTLSVIRRGWERVMIPLMVEAIAGNHPAPPGLEAEVADYVDRSTGILTIKQMEWLVTQVRRYGLADEILSARAYKRIYNERLLAPVRERMARLDGSDDARETLRIAGARDFLHELRARSVALYLASGSDHEYVIEEAAALGVAEFFGDEVYGARDTGPNGAPPMTKGDVIARILADHDLHGEELLVVGDGPVEIRQGKAQGAVALGIAADEAARQGLDPRKRERLLRAGADLIVTDFTHYGELATLLVGK